ncbi:hypothetical protein [Streptomyces doudnae]|uniref:hypothetical protein n=1 Tax=Streptomyces doudnae TaxID=3075536 RepID=UPI00374E0A90
MTAPTLTALALVCGLKGRPTDSSSELIADQVRENLGVRGTDILLLSTPVWLGHPSSSAQRVLERLDAELSHTDEVGRPVLAGKVATRYPRYE